MKLLNKIINKKAVLGVLLTVAMAAGFLVPAMGVSAATGGPGSLSVYVTPAVQDVANGTTFNVQIDIDNNVPVNGWQINVGYDATKLTLNTNSVSEGNFLTANGGSAFGLQEGTPTAGSFPALADSLKNGATAPVGTSGNLLTLSFTAIANNVATPITLSGLVLTNASGNAITGGVVGNGTIVVGTPPPPVVNSFTPTTGADGQSVVITGSGFTGATAVSFGGTAATSFIVNSDTQIIAIVGAGTTGVVNVANAISPSGGSSTATFTYTTAPDITTFTPSSADKGTTVTINGAGFAGVTGVYFGGTAATSFNVVSVSQITAIVNSGATGAVTVVEPNGTATSSTNFTYLTASITSFTPTAGYPGNSVTITGIGFTGCTGINFNGTNAPTFNVVSDTQMTVTVPNGTTGVINVGISGGGVISSTTSFTFITDGVNEFMPTSGYTGDLVTINGAGFTGATAVHFGTTPATSFVVVSNTQIDAYVGNGATGAISVATTGGTVTSATNFTYEQVAVYMSPNTQQLTSIGQTFTISLNLNTNGSKQIRGWQANISFDPTQLQCTGVTEGSFFNSFKSANAGSSTSFGSATIDNTDGTITGLYDALLGANQAGATGTGTVAALTFTAIGGAGAMVSITPSNVIVTDVNGNAIANVMVTGASVTLSPNVPSSAVPVNANLYPQLTLVAPAPINGWDLVVSANNNVQRTLNVFANTDWQVTVQSDSTNGYLTEWNPTTGLYINGVSLSNPLFINSISLATGGVLATGTPAQQNVSNGGDIQNLMFNQAVTYTDPIVGAPNTLHTVVTYTASNTSY